MQDRLTVDFEGTIRRPLAVVTQQFADLRHHSRNRVHPDITFSILSEDGPVCRFTQEVSLLGLKQKDEVIQKRQADGMLESEVVAGTNKGMRIVQSFAATGQDSTAVKLHIEAPAVGVKKLFKPLFEAAIRTTVRKAFEQDRVDLEERGYPRD